MSGLVSHLSHESLTYYCNGKAHFQRPTFILFLILNEKQEQVFSKRGLVACKAAAAGHRINPCGESSVTKKIHVFAAGRLPPFGLRSRERATGRQSLIILCFSDDALAKVTFLQK